MTRKNIDPSHGEKVQSSFDITRQYMMNFFKLFCLHEKVIGNTVRTVQCARLYETGTYILFCISEGNTTFTLCNDKVNIFML